MNSNNDYHFQLDSPRVTGRRQQKTTCPQCGRKKCFVRYVDTHDNCNYVNDAVGRCDHEQSCGYHYTPAQYFKDHPWLGEQRFDHSTAPSTKTKVIIPVEKPFQPLPMDYVVRRHSTQSTFWQWLVNNAAPRLSIAHSDLQRIYEDYMIGATREGDIIFWQIDEQSLVHGGHIMRYRTDGHRQDYQGWVHDRLMKASLLPPDYRLHQCLFGQHLLALHPDAQVCIVESEKTALLLSARHRGAVWLATCGSSGLTVEKTACLKDRRITIFPDSGCYDKWLKVMQQSEITNYTISDHMEAYEPNTDLADLLLGEANPRDR